MSLFAGTQLLLMLVGLVLAFTGVWLYFYAISALGAAIGGGIGFLLSTGDVVLGGGPMQLAVATLVGAGIGVVLVWIYIKWVVMAPGFVLGFGLTYLAVGPYAQLMEPGEWLNLVAVIGGGIGALLAWLLFEVMVAVVTASIGAMLVRLSLQAGSIVASIKSLFPAGGEGDALLTVPWFVTDLLYLVVFLLGVGVQLGGRYLQLGSAVMDRLGLGSGGETASEG